jgi:2-phosphosulfolactate phosphatase
MSSYKIKSIDVCLSPDLMHLYDLTSRSVVVVDILRATSCMTTAFAHGIKSITPFAALDACKLMKMDDFFIAGERNGEKVDGFDLGNSPFEYMHKNLKGKKIAFTTTNGTQAIDKSAGAKEIIIGSFLNLTAVANHLKNGTNDILIVCAGWKGKVNLEDTLFAGALVEKLGDAVKPECDAPLMALHLYRQAKSNMTDFLKDSSHVQRLNRLNIHNDIEFCLDVDQYDLVPILKDGVIAL